MTEKAEINLTEPAQAFGDQLVNNLLVKIPATAAGIRAIDTLTGEGLSINVTLMFSLTHVDAVAGAYQRGLEALAAAGGDLSRVRSVASVFLSRWETLIDRQRGNGQ